MVLRCKQNGKFRHSACVLLGISSSVIMGLIWYNFDGILTGYYKLSTMMHQINQHDNHFTEKITNITLVTAYFDLGTIQRSGKVKFRTKEDYLRWAKMYQYVENPLVCYTDDIIFFSYMTSLRMGKEHKTNIFKIQRNSTWAFQREPRVKEIFSQPGYPRYHPNTGTSEYPCTQFAKYDVIVRAAKANYFSTKYIAWIDIGHFRHRKSQQSFVLKKLDSHNESRVAMSRVFNVALDVTPKEIFYGHLQWLAGSFVFGTREIIIRFADQFKRTVDYYLSKNIISTDEQVIYAMFSNQGRKEVSPKIEIQYNQARGWFGLGTKMIREMNNTV